MDYTEALSSLTPVKSDNQSLQAKATLLFAIISMFESNRLNDNEIVYDSNLEEAFAESWRVMYPGELIPHTGASDGFWYMSSEPFWHVIPTHGHEDIGSLMSDTSVKPSKTAINDSVKYVELDEDLHFLMTIASGRKSLKEALLSSYANLSERDIQKVSHSGDSFEDKSAEAINAYKEIINSASDSQPKSLASSASDKITLLDSLDEDIKIELVYSYYSFLKKYPIDRESLKQIHPTVSDLYLSLTSGFDSNSKIDAYFIPRYEAFLQDLKTNLMGLNSSLDLIEGINEVLKGVQSEHDDYEPELTDYTDIDDFSEPIEDKPLEDIDTSDTIDYYPEPNDFFVENDTFRCAIYVRSGEKVFSDKGKLKIIRGIPYRINLKAMCLTIKQMERIDNVWSKGPSVIVAYKDTDLYDMIDASSMLEDIEDIEVATWNPKASRIKYRGIWYAFNGTALEIEDSADQMPDSATAEVHQPQSGNYTPKGKLKAIDEIAQSSYDYLWIMAIVDLMGDYNQSPQLSYDEIACRMIANAWEILNENEELKSAQESIVQCIDFLIEESKEYMSTELNWESTANLIYESIRDYPMAGSFEDTVDELLDRTPATLLKLWLPDLDSVTMTMYSQNFQNACLYALHPKSVNPYIEINPKWKRSLFFDHDNLVQYYRLKYINYLRRM